MFLLIGVVAQALLEFELTHFFGRRRMEREIDRLSGHFIICGAGRVGRSTARELALKPVPFVIIENAAVKMEPLPPEWLVIRGDATQEPTLRQAHIERARGLVAATTTDATNIYIVLTARGLNPEAQDHCPRQRGRRREAPQDRRRRFGDLAVSLCRAQDCAVVPAAARARFHRFRHGAAWR